MSSRPFVDFYTERKVIPTRQDVSDLARHFCRREALYRHLGIPKVLLTGASVIEFGPGSGHNALFTASARPGRYVLVDATPASLEATRSQFATGYAGQDIQVVESDILTFRTDERFDLVLCEGVIPTQNDPAHFLRHIASFARPGGLVVMTCMDAISVLPEILRRYLARKEIHGIENFDRQVEVLVKFFQEDLTSLVGMSRHHEDWVVDQMLHPWSGPLFSVQDALGAIGESYEFYGASPQFMTDWRWHKSIQERPFGFNHVAEQAYFSCAHNFLDHRYVNPPREAGLNRALSDVCAQIYAREFAAEKQQRDYSDAELGSDLQQLLTALHGCHPVTREALTDFLQYLESGDPRELKSFRQLWGRGQQYLSFIRNDTSTASSFL
jgi:ubiquinone/menaquinone biosynthesis C-methylase UbiE